AADQRCQDSAAAADPRDVLLQSCHRLGTTCGSRVAAIEEAVHRDARHAELGKRCDRSGEMTIDGVNPTGAQQSGDVEGAGGEANVIGEVDQWRQSMELVPVD